MLQQQKIQLEAELAHLEEELIQSKTREVELEDKIRVQKNQAEEVFVYLLRKSKSFKLR